MPLRLIAVGTRMPEWVDAAFTDYARRMHGAQKLALVELPVARRTAGEGDAGVERATREEGRRMLALLAADESVILLDERGEQFTSRELAARLALWQRAGKVSFLIGGPDGFAKEVAARATQHWSLSRLTLPHGLARVMVAEALYRAVSLQAGHPYHRD